MSIEVKVPNLPESVADATIATWHKKIGDKVTRDENILDLETDKVVLEVPSPIDGILQEILFHEGDTVHSGDLLARIETGASAAATAPANPKGQDVSALDDKSTGPAVRRLLAENDLQPNQIKGSGKDGRVTKDDVMTFIESSRGGAPVVAANVAKKPADVPMASSAREERRVPMSRLRAKVAERLLQAQHNAAMLTTFNEVNMQNVIDLRNQYKARFEQKHAVKLGFMSFFVKASIEALKHFPAINASIDGSDIVYHGYYDLGIAVSTPRGLIVPVLHDADQLDFAGIEKSISGFGEKARAGTLSYDDLKGGTFTITNGGVFGSMLSTPILNPPQCAILGMHAIKERAVVENGQIVIRPIMYLALSYDHRLVDGREAVQFLVTIKECLESPAHLLLNI